MAVILRRVVVGVLDTNCWIMHAKGAREALVVDPGDDPGRIVAACQGLDVVAIALTHTHFDHVLGVRALVDTLAVPVLAHGDEAPVWPHELDTAARSGVWDAGTATDSILANAPHRLAPPTAPLWNGAFQPVAEGETIEVGPLVVRVLHTPGHTPGGLTLYAGDDLLTGDTLFPGGPGLTGPALSNFDTIIGSVRRLLAMPASTRIRPGHGASTTVGAQRPHLEAWVARRW